MRADSNIQCIPTPALWLPRAWSPADLPGLALDLDSRRNVWHSIGPDIAAADGQSVRRWVDLLGARYDQARATNQPIYRTGGVNGLPYLESDGLNDSMGALDGLGMLRSVAGVTVFVVAQSFAIGATRTAIRVGIGTGTASRVQVGQVSTASRMRTGGRRLDGDAFASADGGDHGLALSLFGAEFDYAAARLTARLNGAQVALNASFQTPGMTSDTDSQRIDIFASSGTGEFWSGRIYRILFYARTLQASERIAVENYLRGLYSFA